MRKDEILGCLEEGSRDCSIPSPSKLIVFSEMPIKMLLESLIPNEAHSANRALELNLFVDFSNSEEIWPIVLD